MIIVSQDKELILNFKNIEAIGIGNPLEDDDGMFKVLASTTSDNEYTLAIKNNLCTGCNRLELLEFKGLKSCKYAEKENKWKQEEIWKKNNQ